MRGIHQKSAPAAREPDHAPESCGAVGGGSADTTAARRDIHDQLRHRHLTPHAVSYLRGGRFLLETRRDDPHALIAGTTAAKKSLKAVAEVLAQEYGTDADTIITDGRFAAAVDRITDSCGVGAKTLILSGRTRLTAKQVGQISRCHPERQRHEMAEVTAGRRPFAKPRSGVPVFDTLDYGEVVSRLRRAAGLLRRQFRVLSASTAPPVGDQATRLRNAFNRCMRQARELARLLGVSPRRAAAHSVGAQPAPAARSWAQVAALVAAAGGLIEKNVRDVPRMPATARPSGEQLAKMAVYLGGVSASCRAAVRFLCSESASGEMRSSQNYL